MLLAQSVSDKRFLKAAAVEALDEVDAFCVSLFAHNTAQVVSVNSTTDPSTRGLTMAVLLEVVSACSFPTLLRTLGRRRSTRIHPLLARLCSSLKSLLSVLPCCLLHLTFLKVNAGPSVTEFDLASLLQVISIIMS